MTAPRPLAGAWALALALAALSTACVALLALAGHAAAQTDPPPLGLGDWTIADATVLQDRFVLLNGSLTISPGGDLTMRNSTIVFVLNERGEHGLLVRAGGALRVLDGSRIAGSRLSLGWTFVAQAGSTLRVVGSTIDDCGQFGYGERANWAAISFYIGTEDAVLEGSTFDGGFVGPCFPEGVIAPAPRNCTFGNYYGMVTWGTSVERCTFVDQLYYGVLMMGGTETVVRDCTFEGVFGASVSVGLDERPIGPIDVATGVVEGCRFLNASVGVRCAVLSHATVRDCSFDGMATAAIYPEQGMIEDPEGIIAYVELVNGDCVNTTVVILPAWRAWVNWTVTRDTTVVGGNVSLCGNLRVLTDAGLRLLECRDLTQANRPGKPTSISLEGDARLEIVNGSLLVPREEDSPHDWSPIEFSRSDRSSLVLVGATTVNVSFPVALGNLSCERTRLPLGEWHVETAELVDCVLFGAPSGPATLHIRGTLARGSRMVRCSLEGLHAHGGQPWLDLMDTDLVSEDTLHDLLSDIESGDIGLNASSQAVAVTVLWSTSALVRWQNQAPAPGAAVSVRDVGGNTTLLTTDEHGATPTILLRTEHASYIAEDVGRLPPRVTVSALYPFTFSADAAGIKGETVVARVESPLEVVIAIKDLVPPVIAVDQPDYIATNRSTVRITGNATDAHSGLAFLEAGILPQPYSRVPVSGSGAFAVELSLSTGLQVASLRLYDSVGNRAATTITIYFTQTPPPINVTEPQSGAWVNTTLVYVAGLTVRDSTVEIRGRTQTAVGGEFRIPVPVVEGENVLLVNATDVAGNHNQTFVVVNVDTVPPGLAIIAPPRSPYATRESPEEVEGRTDPGARAFINTVEVPVDAFGAFSAKVTLRQGLQVVSVVAMDEAGNQAVVELVFSLDSQPPVLSVLWPPEEGLLTNRSPVEVRLLTEVGVVLTVNGALVPVTAPSVTYPLGLSEGANAIVVIAHDAAGNAVEVRRTVSFHRAPPDLRLQPPPPTRTADPFLRLSGVTEPNSTVVVNGLRVSVFSDGVFSRVVLLSEGRNRIEVVATDEYGNTANLSCVVEMLPTQPPPHEARPTLVWALLTLSAVVLGVEAAYLLVRRSRARGPQEGGKGG